MSSYNRFDMCNAIDSYVINERYRRILHLRYCEGHTYEEIGEIVGYSTQHVRYICKSYRDMLMSHL
ncbi:MAG: hypothetical protein J6S50_10945 [Oscillospiraceae bacterium]|nr:hypothetical protein [Oscillospiraceae bacterium]